jgi:methylenetetrahydrofolate reductase (NADPH)
MKPDSKLAKKIESGEFIVTAEYLPPTGTDAAVIEAKAKAMGRGPVAVNVTDNRIGIAASSLATSIVLSRAGTEPVYQIVTRDRNRIALQSDLLGAALLGIKNVLCLSGHHQTLTGCPESANVFDIDSIQLIAAIRKMNEEGLLINNQKINGSFGMLIGAAANPYMKPIELNTLRVEKKAAAGATFLQTHAIYDTDVLEQWTKALRQAGIIERVAILVGILPLNSAEQAQKLNDNYTDSNIPSEIIDRMKAAGDADAQKKEGLAIAAEIIGKVKNIKGIRGIHVFSGGNETIVPELMTRANLK